MSRRPPERIWLRHYRASWDPVVGEPNDGDQEYIRNDLAYERGLSAALEAVEIIGHFEGPPGLGEQGSWNERGNADKRSIERLLEEKK